MSQSAPDPLLSYGLDTPRLRPLEAAEVFDLSTFSLSASQVL